MKFTILERFDFLIKIYENDDGNDNDDDDDCDDDDDITMTSTMKTMTTKDLKDDSFASIGFQTMLSLNSLTGSRSY